MKHMNSAELRQCEVLEPVLDACLAVTENALDEDVAVMVTKEGLIVASAAAWQAAQLAIGNLTMLMSQQGVASCYFLLGDAREIRTVLHDADASRRQKLNQSSQLQLDHTRAQQALEDLVHQALTLNASDIHLLFDQQQASLSFRVHGRMAGRVERTRETLVAAIAAALNTRSDDFHELFDEQRLSSASINVTLVRDGKPQRIRLRVQKSPTRNGFAVTMRIQREQQQVLRLQDLGLPTAIAAGLRLLIEQPAGMLLIAGPTGQGKTTTLAAINLLIPPDSKVISLEDPIEIIQPHIEQKPVLADHPDLNFANMVKVALREDPDVISISEIRDQGTARAAYTAALTGHLVTATIHAHDSFGVIQRLLDLGLSASALAQPGVLRGILAQRLVVEYCDRCDVDAPAVDCSRCNGTGITGRRYLGELLQLNEKIRQRIRDGRLADCRQELLEEGWLGLDEQLAGLHQCA